MSTNTLPSSSTPSPEISPPKYSTEIVEMEKNSTSSPGITAGQNDREDLYRGIATASSSKNLASSADFEESKKTWKKAVKFVIATGRMPKGTGSTSVLKRVASRLFVKDKGESSETAPSDNTESVEIEVPKLYNNPIFQSSVVFRDVEARVNELFWDLKLCLYCFSVFPENTVIKKRLMKYWWMGEFPMAEELASKFFNMLIAEGFIVPIHEKSRPDADSCRMPPLVRLAVIMLAEKDGFFDFDEEGNPTASFSNTGRACLLGKGFPNHQTSNLGRLCTLFNRSEHYLDFKPDLLFKMKRAKVLYLGLWQASAQKHIEVDNADFLSGLKSMKLLRLFSLQGVSGISKLPEDAFSKLRNLLILDLRACHSLEVIPENIGLLKSLTHLDVSECYLLEHMPKGLASLLNLQVLKGFLVLETNSDRKTPCTLQDLAKLPKLRKLSIFICVMDFPDTSRRIALDEFPALRKLTVEWGEDHIAKREHNSDHTKVKPQLLREVAMTEMRLAANLTKLDLLCLPGWTTPNWLNPAKLPCLKELYIRGAVILDLGQFVTFDREHKWTVEVLRLKHMPNLDMDWTQFQELFPNVIYLEIIECPKLNFFPCDARGMWVNKSKLSIS